MSTHSIFQESFTNYHIAKGRVIRWAITRLVYREGHETVRNPRLMVSLPTTGFSRM